MQLSEWLVKTKTSQADFGRQLSPQVDRSTVTRWCKTPGEAGHRIPKPIWLRQIAAVTKGKVTAADFMGLR